MRVPHIAPDTAQLVHLALEWLAMAAGFQVYRRLRARGAGTSVLAPGTFGVLLGCILGAALGNKLVFWIEFPHLWAAHGLDPVAWMSGQSIVGGLLGGLLGVEIAKKLTGVTRSTGDDFVLPLMVGTVIGRIGCFLAGLNDGTYGVPTALPWGVDFGDGVARHPTQLYDIAFVLAWGGGVLALRPRWRSRPGLAFKVYLAGYLGWRLVVDSIKPLHFDYGWGLGGIQLVCLVALLCYLPLLLKQLMEPVREPLPVQ